MARPNGPKIRDLRESRGFTQEELAGKAGFSTTTIQRVERGVAVSPRTLKSIAQALGGVLLDVIGPQRHGDCEATEVEIRDDDLIELGVDVCSAVKAELGQADADALRKVSDGAYQGKTVRAIDHVCNDTAYRVFSRWSKTTLHVMGEDIDDVTRPSRILCCLDSLDGTENWARGRKLYSTVVSFFVRQNDKYRLRVSIVMDAEGRIYSAREDTEQAHFAENREAFLAREPSRMTVDCRKQRLPLITDLQRAHICTVARRPDHYKVLAPLLAQVPSEGLYCFGGNLELACLARSGFDAVFQLNATERDSQGFWDWLPGAHIAFRAKCVILGLGPKRGLLNPIAAAEAHLNECTTASPGYVVATNKLLAEQIADWVNGSKLSVSKSIMR